MTRNCLLALGLALFVAACGDNAGPTDGNLPDLATSSLKATDRINVVLKAPATAAYRTELSRHGAIYDEIPQLNAILMRAKLSEIVAIRALPFVKAVSQDQPRNSPPDEFADAEAFVPLAPHNVWNLDAINVTDFDPGFGAARQISENGTGVYVAVLDTGLMPFWPFYFQGKNIATQYATTFAAGGASGNGAIVSPPDKWEGDTHGHGTHVSSTILGFRYLAASAGGLPGFQVDGVAPNATLIPVKVLNNGGGGWSSAIAKGVVYVTDLFKTGGPLAGSRAVINMSLGGSVLDAVEQESLDYATSNGVVVVAAAGNSGPDGNLSFPGGYAPVIAVASAGWIGEWNNRGIAPFNPACAIIDPAFDALLPGRFWRQCDVPEPYASANFYVSSFSSRDPDGLDTGANYDLDVAAPGSWVVGPWGFNNGQINYAIAGGTSQATPHVAGIVALMLQKNPALTPAQIESCLETAAQPLTDTNQQVSPAPAGLVPAPLITPQNWGTDRSGHGFITADAALNSSCFS